ncbi:GNAT family N-acetyltransferase [Paenibacillus sp. JTLBN-2024]
MPYSCEGNIPELEGERVVLRRLAARDAQAMFECWSDPEVRRFADLPRMPDAAAAAELIGLLNRLALTDDSLRWGIQAPDGSIIGSCGLNWWQLEGAYRGEIGCELSRPFWGGGLHAGGDRPCHRLCYGGDGPEPARSADRSPQ